MRLWVMDLNHLAGLSLMSVDVFLVRVKGKKLLQLQKEMTPDEPKTEIRVTWIEDPEMPPLIEE